MERSQSQLRTRFTDRLRRDNADSLSQIDRTTGSQHTSIALGADSVTSFASQDRTHLHMFKTGCGNFRKIAFRDKFARLDDNFTRDRVNDIFNRSASQEAFFKRDNRIVAVLVSGNVDAILRMAIFFDNNEVLRHIDQTTGQVTSVSRF